MKFELLEAIEDSYYTIARIDHEGAGSPVIWIDLRLGHRYTNYGQAKALAERYARLWPDKHRISPWFPVRVTKTKTIEEIRED